MASEPLYDVIKAEHIVNLQPSQVAVEAKLVPSTAVKISKILTVSADSEIVSCEPLEKEARYGGRVNFKVLFLNGEGAVSSMDYNADFSDKIMDNKIKPSCKLNLEATTLDIDTIGVTAGELRVSAVVEVKGKMVVTESINCLSDGGEEIYTQTDDITYDIVSAKAEEIIFLSEEFECRENIVSIMLCEATVVPNSAKAGLDCIIVDGKVNLNIIYINDQGIIKNDNFIADYSQEVLAMGARAEDRVLSTVTLKSVACTLAEDVSSDKKYIKCDIALKLTAQAFSETKAPVVVDAFSLSAEINIVGESIELHKYLGSRRFSENIEGSASLGSDLPQVDKILSVCSCRAQVANAYTDSGYIVVEGIVNTGIIYWNNEFETRNSVTVELPYSVRVPCDLGKDSNTVEAKACVTQIQARPTKNNEIFITANLVICAEFYQTTIGYVIKEIKIEGPKMDSNAAISIYVAKKGEKLWDVAKALCSTPQQILSQNPHLTEPLKGGERIMYYRQIIAR